MCDMPGTRCVAIIHHVHNLNGAQLCAAAPPVSLQVPPWTAWPRRTQMRFLRGTTLTWMWRRRPPLRRMPRSFRSCQGLASTVLVHGRGGKGWYGRNAACLWLW